MNEHSRYLLGCCLQVVGLLNVVFLIGIPIWVAGRWLCRDARTADRSPPVPKRPLADGDSTKAEAGTDDPPSADRSPASRPEQRVPVRRN